jgi:hypothetical protein
MLDLQNSSTVTFARRACFVQSARAIKHPETMTRLSRRSFLTASAALATGPAFAAGTAATPPVDVVIIGAGAAGIAAARRIAAAGRKLVVIEAADHVGGRCVTDTRTFGVPYDRGAHWIHAPDFNPLMRLTVRRGLEVYPAPAGQKVRIGRRYAREGEQEDFLTVPARRRCRTISATGGRRSISCSALLAAGKTSRRSRRWISPNRSSAIPIHFAGKGSAR